MKVKKLYTNIITLSYNKIKFTKTNNPELNRRSSKCKNYLKTNKIVTYMEKEVTIEVINISIIHSILIQDFLITKKEVFKANFNKIINLEIIFQELAIPILLISLLLHKILAIWAPTINFLAHHPCGTKDFLLIIIDIMERGMVNDSFIIVKIQNSILMKVL